MVLFIEYWPTNDIVIVIFIVTHFMFSIIGIGICISISFIINISIINVAVNINIVHCNILLTRYIQISHIFHKLYSMIHLIFAYVIHIKLNKLSAHPLLLLLLLLLFM